MVVLLTLLVPFFYHLCKYLFIKSFVGEYLPYEREKLYITWFMAVFLLLTNNVKLDFFQIVKGLKILALKDQKVGKIWEERHIKISNNYD